MKSVQDKKETKAAVVIQTNFRRYGARLVFIMLMSNVVLCQAVVRQLLALKHSAALRHARDSKAALVIQTNVRRHSAMAYLLRYKKAALLVQTHFRGVISRDDLRFRHYCVTRMQASVRGLLGELYYNSLALLIC
jgi:myosin-5